MPIEGIKMSLLRRAALPLPLLPPCLLPRVPLSLLKLGWWPSATEDTKANKSSPFQHLPGPKGLPAHPRRPIPCEDGSLAFFLFQHPSILPH